jgi:ribosomal protein S18 acetylase RimI-like enzyme
MVALVTAHGGQAVPGWWDQIRPHSLGWVTARLPSGGLAGFVNVAWDGADHAFLLDTKVAGEYQRQGIATALVGQPSSMLRQRVASGYTSTSGHTWRRCTTTPAAFKPHRPE